MQPCDSLAVSTSLASYARDRLAESSFFSDLSAGAVPPGHVREVFGQYHLWGNRFHQWFGVCVAKLALAEGPDLPRALSELIEWLAQEINGNKYGLAVSFLAALGIDNPARVTALPVTDAYAESFLHCYSAADRTGDDALAALVGRELAVPGRNRIIVSALPRHYGVTAGLELFGRRADLEAEHFRALWETFVHSSKADSTKLIETARLEIWEHITFWDDVYSAVLATSRLSVADRVMARNN